MKIVIVGGGSVAWTPRLVRDFLMTPPLADARFTLLDIDRPAAELTAAVSTRLAETLAVGATFTATDDLATGLDGADYVLITITTGGLVAMAHDLAIPERYGIYHTVGDTCGPGGWSRFIRNFDVFVSLGKAIEKHTSGAAVINYTNPLATLTMVLARICSGPVVGLCRGIQENRNFLRQRYSTEEVTMTCGGVNHFFGTTQASADGRDVLADLSARIQKESLDALEPTRQQDPHGVRSGRAVATELFRLTGALPYLADRHTCEFVSWYITDPSRMERHGLHRTITADRQAGIDERRALVRRMARDGIPDGWVRPSGETAAAIVRAHRLGDAFTDVGNLPNVGQVANLPMGVAVETPVRFGRDGFVPVPVGSLPNPVTALVAPRAHAYQLQAQACFDHDRRRALAALRLDPVCSSLATDVVSEMGKALLEANRPHVSWL